MESIEPAGWIRESGIPARWLDFGSGAGFPAIPLAILGLGEKWTLVEARRPKTLFLRKCVEDLQLRNVEIVHGRLELLDPPEDGFDAFTSRATQRLGPTLELATQWVRSGGHAYLWKGSRRDEELRESDRVKESWVLQDIHEFASNPTAVLRLMRN